MSDNRKHVSIRMDADMLDKFYFVAKYNGRSGSMQIMHLMRCFIADFEKEHGEITEEDINKMKSGK